MIGVVVMDDDGRVPTVACDCASQARRERRGSRFASTLSTRKVCGRCVRATRGPVSSVESLWLALLVAPEHAAFATHRLVFGDGVLNAA